MATYELDTKTDIKFICLLDREVNQIFDIIFLEYSYNVFQF